MLSAHHIETAMSDEFDAVKKILRCLLVTVPNGMSVANLERDFFEMEGRGIPYRKFNFRTINEYLNALSDTLRISMQNGMQYVFPITSNHDDHIMKLVSGQKSNRSRSGRHARGSAPGGYKNKRLYRPEYALKTHLSNVHSRQEIHQKPNYTAATNMLRNSDRNIEDKDDISNARKNDMHLFTQSTQADVIANKSSKLMTAERADAEIKKGSVYVSTRSNVVILETNEDTKGCHEADAKCCIDSVIKNEGIADHIAPLECSQENRNMSELECAVGVAEDYYNNVDTLITTNNGAFTAMTNEESDEENDALPKMSKYEFMTLLDDNEYIITSVDPFVSLPMCQYGFGEANSTFKIIVSELEHSMTELEQLKEALIFYCDNISNEDLQLPAHLLKPGQICVAMYKRQWHRARIVDVYEDEIIKVFHLDYGTVEEVYRNDIRLMRKEFAEMPPQAFRGSLDNIRPAGGLWKHEATIDFKHAVENIKVYAKGTGIDKEERTYYMTITDTTKEVDVNITDLLIGNGHAVYEKVPMLQMKRRHYSERYPTFDMLENGEYPSFAEISYFSSEGHDFAIYEQSIIIPKMFGYSAEI